MSVKKIENFNIHEQPESNTDSFGVEAYLNANWEKTKEAVNNNAEELIQAQKDIDANKNDIENINSKNKSQDDTIEALKAENKLIKEQIPSANISGNSIYIEDSSNLDFDWKIKGGHAQTRTTQPENYIDDREARGKTILEATQLYLPIINLKAGSGYYFKIFDSNDKIKNDSRYLAVEFYDINKTKIQSDALGYPNTFTEENTNKIKFAKIYYNKNDTDKAIGSIVIKKIGLKITSSASADDIDMFVPDSPSPDYPSEIETVGSNENLCNGINQGYYLNFETSLCGLLSGNNGLIIPTTGGKYTISTQINQTRYRVACINEKPIEDKTVTAYKGVNKDGTSNNITIDTSGYAYLIINATDLTKIKIERGSTATPYSPYGMGSVEIDVVNKNLFDISILNDYATVNGSEFSFDKGILPMKVPKIYGFNNSKKYILSWKFKQFDSSAADNVRGVVLQAFNKDNKLIAELSSNINKNGERKTEVTGLEYISFSYGNEGRNIIYDLQIEEASEKQTEATQYEPHQSQTAIMPIQQEMLTGDYIKDIEHHEWGKLVLTGDETIYTASYDRFYIVGVSNLEYSNLKDINVVSNYFLQHSGEAFTTADNIIFTLPGNAESIFFRSSKFSTVEEFRKWVLDKYNAGTPVTIYYKLATPTNLKLTEEQKTVRDTKLYTYKNITNINVSDELASVEVEYKKDQDTINKNYENRLAALEAASIS